MAVVDARLRVHHPCPYCDVSVEYPESLLLLWCDNRRDVFLVSSPTAAELREVVSAFRVAFHARALLQEGSEALVAIPDFEWSTPPSVTGLARRAGVWVLHPVLYYRGTETYRFLAPSKVALNRLVQRVRRLGDVEILSVVDRVGLEGIRETTTGTIHFFEGLTDRQTRCLIAAYEGGLLSVPARSKWEDVARREGLSRSTFGEHLRKGQLRLLANSYPSLKARTPAEERPVFLPETVARTEPRRTPLQGIRSDAAARPVRPGSTS
jgi:predicted DNA binding protein